MSDEPRRSVRATKGQHTKSLDLLDQPAGKKKRGGKKGGKKAAAQEEDEEEVIRCVCGAVDQDNDEGEAWIACDNCGVWQHNVCVGLTTYEEDAPETYFCEQCGPDNHRDLLEGVARGEKPWEERRKAYEKAEAEEASKKKGKRGRGKRTSDPKPEISQPAKEAPPPAPATDVKKDKKDAVTRGGSTKRKTRDESAEKEAAKGPQTKMRKVNVSESTPQGTPPSSSKLPVQILDLESSRQGAATLVLKGLVHAIPLAIQSGVYSYREGDGLESLSERLAIQVEDAIYRTHPDKLSYGKQARSIFTNLKINQELCNGLLTKTLLPDALAVMTSDQMASDEKKREEAEMKARADKQAIMVSDDGPRMRRTHKGDEVIEEDNFAVPSDSTMFASRRRSMLDPNADMGARSAENSPRGEVELPHDIDEYRSRDDIRAQVAPKQPLTLDTNPNPAHVRKGSTQGDFDIKKVFSNLQSPTGSRPAIRKVPRRVSTNTAPPANGPGVDPEVDKLLQDDNESPPYSPAEYSDDPEVIWRGVVNMDSVARFSAVAKHIGGADLSHRISWSDLLQKDLRVAGRIDLEKANEYLCSLRYSPPTDVVLVALSPTGEDAAQQFQAMFEYFLSKHRYGVLTNKGVGNIRDTYLVPIPPSPASLPDFITNLEGHKVPENRTSPMILITLVIRNEVNPNPFQGFDGATDVQSPSLPTHPQRQMSISGGGPSMSPIAPQGTFQGHEAPGPSVLAQGDPQRKTQQQMEEQRLTDQRQGEETAVRILGNYVSAPTVHFLMPQAYQMRALEWEVIRDILERDAKAQTDLQHLSHLLEIRMAAEVGKPA